jgi:hypothetical protein
LSPDSPNLSTTPQPESDMKSLLEQYHQIWSTIDLQEAAQRQPQPQVSAKTPISLSEIFSPNNVVMLIAKVSLEVMGDVTESETTLPKEEVLAEKIVKIYTNNQKQLCPARAHTRQQEYQTFMNLRGD